MDNPEAESSRQAPPLGKLPAAPKHFLRRRLIVIGTVGLLLLLVAWFAYSQWFVGERPEDKFVIATIERGDVEDTVTATGTLQPRDYVDVGTQVSGQLKVVHVEIGQQVKQGDLLAEIDPTLLQAKVDADNAQLQNQSAQLADKRAQIVLAEQQLQRQHNLTQEQATTTEALQEAEAALRSLNAQVAAIQAQMKQTGSTLRGDQANLGYTKIYAPMAGTVVSQTAKQGQTLNANQQAPIILRIADLSIMTVQTQVSEADVSKLRIDMTAYFTTLGSQGKRWYGKLRQVNPTPNVTNNVVLYDALFDVPNTDRALMTQMTAQVFFLIGSARDAVLVPVGALRALSPTAKGVAGAHKKSATESKGAPDGAAVADPASPAASATVSPDQNSQPPVQSNATSGAANRAAGEPGGERRRGGNRSGGLKSGASAIVRVVKPDGSIEERTIQIGVMNRVSAQVLAGLEPGEQVIAGMKQPQDVQRAPPPGTPRTPNPSMPPRL